MTLGRLRETVFLQRNGKLIYRNLWTSSMNSMKKNDHKSLYVHEKQEKESWNIPEEREVMSKNEWSGFLHHLPFRKGYTLSLVHALQKGIDIRPSAIVNWYRNFKHRVNLVDQSYRKERVATLGFDLAAAHFLVYRGGKVRFRNAQEWCQKDEDGEYDLLRHYTPDVFVEALDASEVNLLYEGLENMCNVTGHGIAALARLRELKSLNLSGLEQIKDIELLCLLLEDVLPDIQITGIEYMNPKMLQDKNV
ncbi:uncharacterized protein [Panulirus ornatus]|uniref:uncharacterized protein n=1 Tax=Panulirus ornatus TaxID=150431 RepID=UPI003A83F3CE